MDGGMDCWVWPGLDSPSGVSELIPDSERAVSGDRECFLRWVCQCRKHRDRSIKLNGSLNDVFLAA